MADNGNGSSFALGFLVGGILGTVVGILIAPKPGVETRAELAERSEVWRLRAEEMAATVRERMGPAVEGVRERVTPAVEVVRERVGPVVEQVSARVGRSSGPVISPDGDEAAISPDGDGTSPEATEEKA